MSKKLPDLLRAREVAEVFRVAEGTVYQWARRGDIKSVKVNGVIRFPGSEVKRLLKTKGTED